MAGGGGTQTTTTEPPAYLKPYLSDVAHLAQQSFYGGMMPQGAGGGAPAPAGGAQPASSWYQMSPAQRVIALRRGEHPNDAKYQPGAGQPASGNPATGQTGGYNFQWPEYFPGSTVVPFSNETQAALGAQTQRALAGSPVTTAAQQGLLGNLTGQNPAMAQLAMLGQGNANPALSGISGLMGTTNPAIPYAEQLAQGGDITGAFRAARNAITPQVDSAFGLAGRSGSGLAQTAQTQAEADAFANLYNQEQNRKLSAAGLLGNLSGQDFNQNLAALGLQGNLANQDVSNQLTSLGLLGSNYLGGLGATNQAAALAPSLAASDYTDISQLANVGAQRESLSQQQLQDQINRFNYGQQLPYNMLQNYAGLISGVPAIGGSTTMPGASTAQNLLGGGLAGLGLGQSLGVGSIAAGDMAALNAFGLTPAQVGLGASALSPWALGGAALMGILG